LVLSTLGRFLSPVSKLSKSQLPTNRNDDQMSNAPPDADDSSNDDGTNSWQHHQALNVTSCVLFLAFTVACLCVYRKKSREQVPRVISPPNPKTQVNHSFPFDSTHSLHQTFFCDSGFSFNKTLAS
jgi:hypothetical protein